MTTSKTTEPMRVSQVVELAERQFGRPVQKITAPGGRGRASARVHFSDMTAIATYRPDARNRDREIALLQRFEGLDVPAPRILGRQGDVVFQQDLGNMRLSRALGEADDARARELAASGLTSLWKLKQAAEDIGLLDELPAIASSKDWALKYMAAPLHLSKMLHIDPPELSTARVLASLMAKPTAFVKWDARPGNAMVLPDGSISWFDWEHYGRRGGYEDIPFLFGDEFWTLDADASLDAFRATAPDAMLEFEPVLIRMSALQAVQRLSLISERHNEKGWLEATIALGQDRVGTAPELVRRLARHGADWANRDALMEPLADWFLLATDALLSASGKSG